MVSTSGGLRFEGACAKYLGGPFLCRARKNLPVPFMRKCCDL